MREATEMYMIVENLLAHFQCSDIFQLLTGKRKGHEADENIFQPWLENVGLWGSLQWRIKGEYVILQVP